VDINYLVTVRAGFIVDRRSRGFGSEGSRRLLRTIVRHWKVIFCTNKRILPGREDALPAAAARDSHFGTALAIALPISNSLLEAFPGLKIEIWAARRCAQLLRRMSSKNLC